jgi:hypothetical protein
MALTTGGTFLAGFAALTAIIAALMPFLAARIGLPGALGVAGRVVPAGFAARPLLPGFGCGFGVASIGHGRLLYR